MATKPDHQPDPLLIETPVPSVERIQRELASAKSIDDFFGKEGIFARLFAGTLEHMLEAELTAQLGYEPYAVSGRNSGNSRNGKRPRNLRTSAGDMTIQVPRDRTSEFQPALLEKDQTSTNELEDKIIALYAKGVSTRDIQENLEELYGVEVSAQTISTITGYPLGEGLVTGGSLANQAPSDGLSHRLPRRDPPEASPGWTSSEYGGVHCLGRGCGWAARRVGPLGR
jgi:hypothetical protein